MSPWSSCCFTESASSTTWEMPLWYLTVITWVPDGMKKIAHVLYTCMTWAMRWDCWNVFHNTREGSGKCWYRYQSPNYVLAQLSLHMSVSESELITDKVSGIWLSYVMHYFNVSRPLPIIGSRHLLDFNKIHESFGKLGKKYGDFYMVYIFSRYVYALPTYVSALANSFIWW